MYIQPLTVTVFRGADEKIEWEKEDPKRKFKSFLPKNPRRKKAFDVVFN